MRKLLRRIIHLLNRRRAEQDLEAEMSAHREMMAEDRRGSFGSTLRLREQSRDAWGWTWLDQLGQDVVYGARQLRRTPGFTFTALLVLAVGVGLNLSVFQAINAVFDDRIAVRDSAELLRIVRQSPARTQFAFAPGAAEFYRQSSRAAFAYLVSEQAGSVRLSNGAEAVDARAQFVSPDYFVSLGVTPLFGGFPRTGEAGVAVLGFGFWQRYFGADPGVIGRAVRLNDRSVRIVGVTPAEFDGLAPRRTEVWLPADADAPSQFKRANTALFAKLKPGTSISAAEEQMAALAAQLHARQPSAFEDGETIRLRPLAGEGSSIGPYAMLVPMFMLVLLCACANLGNMLLARGFARRHEISTRMAVGAGRWRVVRQLMTENLMLAVLGAAAGLLVGRVGASVLLAQFAPTHIGARITTDVRALATAAALALVSMLAFGLDPALQATRLGGSGTRGRRILVGIQVTVSCLLLVGSGLIARGAQRLNNLGGQLDFRQFAIVEPDLDGGGRAVLDGMAARLSQLPGVEEVAITGGLPVFGLRIQTSPGLPPTFWQSVDPSYFRTMRISLKRGRLFERNESDAVIISESAARIVWPDEDPVGKIWKPMGRTVVGVVENNPGMAMVDTTAMEAYVPLGDIIRDSDSAVLVVRTREDVRNHLDSIRAAVWSHDHEVSVSRLQRMMEAVMNHGSSATEMIGVLGTAASFLAGLGIFGLVAFTVVERTREIAVRIALGARPAHVLEILLAQYAKPLGIGVAAGVMLAAAGARLFSSQRILGLPAAGLLVGVDMSGYALGLGALILVVLAAILIPARRALRIDPATSLHRE